MTEDRHMQRARELAVEVLRRHGFTEPFLNNMLKGVYDNEPEMQIAVAAEERGRREERELIGMREILDRQAKVNVLRPAPDKFKPAAIRSREAS